MWDERLAEVCRRHPDLIAVYESSRGRLGLLLRQTLVPLAAEQMMWVAETRTVARGLIQDLRAAGFEGGTVVLQWLPIEDVARIVARCRRPSGARSCWRSSIDGSPISASWPLCRGRWRCPTMPAPRPPGRP